MKSLVVIDFLQRLPRLLDIIRGPCGAKKRVNRLLHFEVLQSLGTLHPVFPDVEALDLIGLSEKGEQWDEDDKSERYGHPAKHPDTKG